MTFSSDRADPKLRCSSHGVDVAFIREELVVLNEVVVQQP